MDFLSILEKIIASISATVIVVFASYLYWRFIKPSVKINSWIAEMRTPEFDLLNGSVKRRITRSESGCDFEYCFKIVNTSKWFEAKKFEIKLQAIKWELDGNGQKSAIYGEIDIFYDALIKLDRKLSKKAIEKRIEKNPDFRNVINYYPITVKPLKEIVEKYDLRLTVRYTNTINKEFIITHMFKKEKIKFGEFLSDDDVDNEPESVIYYFAYGSNLNREQMKKRCPESEIVGPSMLQGYELLFRKHGTSEDNGYLTIEEHQNSDVPVGIYRISESDEKKLDGFEGVDKNCYKKERINVKFNDAYIEGLVYIMLDVKKGKPSDEYYNKVKTGYKEWEFDSKYLNKACKECEYM